MPASCSTSKTLGELQVTAEQSRLLGNSKRIRLMFGSYGIEVLENSPGLRVSSLYSTHDGERICRTFAVTAYPEVIEPAFAGEHEAIIKGESIGIVFEKNGWLIDKHHLYFGQIETPHGHFRISSDTARERTTRAAIHVYALLVRKDRSEFQYAFIAEVHHPEFLQLEDLATIYGPEFENHLDGRERVGDFLKVVESRILAL